MIKAYHAIGTGVKTPDYREIQAELFDKIAAQGSILPARYRLRRDEMRRRCSPSKEEPGVGRELFEMCRSENPIAFQALSEMAEEVIQALPPHGDPGTKLSCLDLLAGDLDRIFLSVDRWFGNIENGFVFNAEDLIRNGAVARERDALDDIHNAIARACEKSFSTVAGARRSIQRGISLAVGRNTYRGSQAMAFLKECVERAFCGAEVLWTGPLPLDAAIEAWRDGVRVFPA